MQVGFWEDYEEEGWVFEGWRANPINPRAKALYGIGTISGRRYVTEWKQFQAPGSAGSAKSGLNSWGIDAAGGGGGSNKHGKTDEEIIQESLDNSKRIRNENTLRGGDGSFESLNIQISQYNLLGAPMTELASEIQISHFRKELNWWKPNNTQGSNFANAFRLLRNAKSVGNIIRGFNGSLATISVGFDTYDLIQNKIGIARYTYRQSGLIISITAGSAIGTSAGPFYGTIGGGIIGAGFWAGEMFFDDILHPMYNDFEKSLILIESELRSWNP